MLDIQKLCGGYADGEVLHGVDLHIPAGKVTVITGPNGCGKSTLLKTLVGINPKTSGQILVDGRSSDSYSSQELARKIAYLAQNRQVPDITALKMVLHGRFPYLSYPRRYRPEDWAIARKAMETMGIEDLAERSMNSLSGGTRQKVYIAMALVQDTPMILMDEPTTFLDVAHQLQMMEQARFLADSGKAVVMVLHDLGLALRTADVLAVMDQGKIAVCGEPQEVYESGCLQQVFGIELRRYETEDGWQYYCRPLGGGIR
ncbi:MAG: ABC transporter ATP-binding protein [Oscillospiraceae bacterium]|nr:ABC transporter ATP-binding protein [Oscillospiraceae bacterium]